MPSRRLTYDSRRFRYVGVN